MTHNNIYRLFTATILVGALMLLSACSTSYCSWKNCESKLPAAKAMCEKEAAKVVSDEEIAKEVEESFVKARGFADFMGWDNPFNPDIKKLRNKRERAFIQCMGQAGWFKCNNQHFGAC